MGNHSTKHQSSSKARPKKNVHWKSAEPPSQPGKPYLTTIYDASNDVLAVKWDRPNTDGGSPIIGYLVEHRRIGSPLWIKATTTLIPYPEFPIANLEPGWRYQFRVFAQNVVGMSESSLFSDPIAVSLQRNASAPPQFLTELQDKVVLESDKCEFHVNVVGTPQAQINWYKDGFEIFSSRRTKIITEQGLSTLVIHEAALTDEGEIKCTATNRMGHAVTRMQLRIEAPPKIRLPRQYEDGLLVEAGEVIKLKVGVAGRPSPSVAWMHNGEIVRNDERHEIITNDKNSFLKIIKANRRDRGEYNVRAVNKLGEFNASFLVTVTAKPNPPTNVRISMSLAKTVTLVWSAPEDDGGCKIGNYIVEYFRIGWDVWLKAASTRQLTATLDDLIEGSEYKFRVKAESPYGMSEPSVESQTIFIPDHRRGIISPARETLKVTLSPRSERRTNTNAQTESSVSDKQIVTSDASKNIHLFSKIYDSESIARELNYGAKVDIVYKKKEITTSSTRSRDDGTIHNERILKTTKMDVQQNDKLSIPKRSDGAHSSNEFMLVLYDEEKSPKEKDQFDLDLKEAISPPPLSFSVPDLQNISEHQLNSTMRRSASSTELLYEKVMQRFYQAVELDEAEMEKKRCKSVDPQLSPKLKEQKLSSNRTQTVHSDVDAFKNLSPQFPMKQSDHTNDNDWSDLSTDDTEEGTETDVEEYERNLRQEILESQRRKSDSKERFPNALYEDDYTDSTESTASVSVSASVESMEQFLNSVRSASSSTTNIRTTVNDELETYHPRMEVVRTLSPQRFPDPGQAAVVLNKPLPLPDPDYVPKPILKRTSDNTLHDKSNEANNDSSIVKSAQTEEKIVKVENIPEKTAKIEEKSEKTQNVGASAKRGFLSLFGKKTPSNENLKKVPNESQAQPISHPSTQINVSTAPEKKKKIQLRQNSMEENKVAIDHYSDLVRELGGRPKARIPLYLDSDAARAAAERAEWEEKQEILKAEQEEREATARRVKAEEEEEEENNRVQELTMKLKQYQEPSANPRSRSSSFQKDMVEISVEQTKSITYSLREIKQENANGINETPNSIDYASGNETLLPSMTTPNRVKVSPIRRQRSESIASHRSQSKSPVGQHRTSLTSTVLRVTRMPIENNIQNIHIDISRSDSPEQEQRCQTSNQIQTDAETNVKSTISYITDLAIFAFACWLYLFKDARYAVPVIGLMIYRQARSAVELRLQKWKKYWRKS